MESKYAKEPFTPFEQGLIQKMIDNGTPLEGAIKVRIAERRRKKLLKIEGKSVTIQC
jgi:hypothetical protein